MGGEYAEMELASFMSTSKGFVGEYVLFCLCLVKETIVTPLVTKLGNGFKLV